MGMQPPGYGTYLVLCKAKIPRELLVGARMYVAPLDMEVMVNPWDGVTVPSQRYNRETLLFLRFLGLPCQQPR
jgi:hypothetical protein